MNTPLKSIPEELLVLEVLSRSSANRSRILTANLSDLLLSWLKGQLQCFPDDEEMLSFGDDNSGENRDEEWMRSTSLLLTILDHFNAVFLPLVPQRGLEAMQRSEVSSSCSLLCGVELTRLLAKCKERKEESWSAMARWLRREIMLCLPHETPERQTTMKESLAAAGEERWLRRVCGDLTVDNSDHAREAVDDSDHAQIAVNNSDHAQIAVNNSDHAQKTIDGDLLVFLLLQPTVSDTVAELSFLALVLTRSTKNHLAEFVEPVVYALALKDLPFLRTEATVFSTLTLLSSLPPSSVCLLSLTFSKEELRQRQSFLLLLFLLLHERPELYRRFLTVATEPILLVSPFSSSHPSPC